jgi:hypothetical protein
MIFWDTVQAQNKALLWTQTRGLLRIIAHEFVPQS